MLIGLQRSAQINKAICRYQQPAGCQMLCWACLMSICGEVSSFLVPEVKPACKLWLESTGWSAVVRLPAGLAIYLWVIASFLKGVSPPNCEVTTAFSGLVHIGSACADC